MELVENGAEMDRILFEDKAGTADGESRLETSAHGAEPKPKKAAN